MVAMETIETCYDVIVVIGLMPMGVGDSPGICK